MDYKKLEIQIVSWLEKYLEDSGLKGFVVGISGGVDSAVVSTLCAKTKYPVYCIELPIHQHSDHVSRASNHIKWLQDNFKQIEKFDIDLSDSFDVFSSKLSKNIAEDSSSTELADANLRSRMRMCALYYASNMHGLLVAGTGNKVEDFGVGFFTVGGDGQVDLSPIADLLKTEVWEFSKYLGVNKEITDAIPSDGLWGDTRSDEDQLKASYPELEWAMSYLDEIEKFEPLSRPLSVSEEDLSPRQKEVLEVYTRLNSRNQFKMVPTPMFNADGLRDKFKYTQDEIYNAVLEEEKDFLFIGEDGNTYSFDYSLFKYLEDEYSSDEVSEILYSLEDMIENSLAEKIPN